MNEKMKLIERLVKDGSIDLSEALVLLEKDTVQVQPYVIPYQQPYIIPHGQPTWPWPIITCKTVTEQFEHPGSTSFVRSTSYPNMVSNFTN